METIIKSNTLKDKLIAEFELSKNSLFGDLKLREQAMESFSRQGIPGRKSEEYKYVNIELMLKGEIMVGPTLQDHQKLFSANLLIDNAIVISIVNGRYAPETSNINNLPNGISIMDITAAEQHPAFRAHYGKYVDLNADPFAALNTAIANGGIMIHVTENALIERPIQIIHLGSVNQNTLLTPRNLIIAERNSQVKIIEYFQTANASERTFTNALTELFVGENAIVDHYKIQNENDLGYLLSTTNSIQKKQSVFSTNTFTLSGSLVRNNLTMALDGEFIESHLNGLYLTNGNQVVDNHTLVDHQKPNCNSNELYKGIIEDKSSATFNGKIYVRKDAQKTNAFQSNKNILLSDDGTINTKPQLEIYADDVKCSHGTSTGKLDEDKIFYLRARGLSEMSAKKLLMHAFASEVVDTIKIEELREYIEEKISQRFE